jgi:hypothetical protein
LLLAVVPLGITFMHLVHLVRHKTADLAAAHIIEIQLQMDQVHRDWEHTVKATAVDLAYSLVHILVEVVVELEPLAEMHQDL